MCASFSKFTKTVFSKTMDNLCNRLIIFSEQTSPTPTSSPAKDPENQQAMPDRQILPEKDGALNIPLVESMDASLDAGTGISDEIANGVPPDAPSMTYGCLHGHSVPTYHDH